MSEDLQSTDLCGGHDCPLADDTAQLLGIGRRDFLVKASLLAAAVALAACGAGGDAGTAPQSVSGTLKVSDYPSLATVGGVALVLESGSPVAVVRTGESSFVVLSRICPHQGATVNQTSNGFQCPRHGATFSRTGGWTGGERTSGLRSYPASYDPSTGILTIG